MEKDMIHDFYHNTRAEIKELEARVSNFDTDMQDLEEAHRTQVKVFMQKVKHLEYEHSNNCERVRIDANKSMADERVYHTNRDKDMLVDKKRLKEQLTREDLGHQTEIDNTERALNDENSVTKAGLEDSRNFLIDKYEMKLKALREELELRMKVEIHEIEERKNQHINELMKNHEEAFKEMKEYHNDITRENLELIRMSKDKKKEIEQNTANNVQTLKTLKERKEQLEGPLQNATNQRDNLKRQLANYDKDVMALRNAKARLQVLRNKEN
jgi:hypothetical protein